MNNKLTLNKHSNHYALLQFKRNEETDTQEFQEVVFYEMKEDGTFENGTTIEEMVRVCVERLTQLNGEFPCRENSIAITKLQEANMWLEARTADRKARGVEGKHIA